ncbi:hypothetical protein HYT25_01605 [Candidatus Pacearchaeota archaeon]|nr:hypothetical protein [Candidatus Pacearchaeota archaeon]
MIIDDLFKDLTDYSGKLEYVEVNGRRYRTKTDANPSIILGQAFGANYDKNSYNQVLAESVIDARQFFGDELAVIVQSEIGKCLDEYGEFSYHSIGEVYEDDEISKIGVFSKIDTQGVLKLSEEVLKKLGLEKEEIVYVAHPAHVYRVMKIGNKIGFNGFPFISKDVEWASGEIQPWTRSKYFWIPREIATRIHHKIKGIM